MPVSGGGRGGGGDGGRRASRGGTLAAAFIGLLVSLACLTTVFPLFVSPSSGTLAGASISGQTFLAARSQSAGPVPSGSWSFSGVGGLAKWLLASMGILTLLSAGRNRSSRNTGRRAEGSSSTSTDPWVFRKQLQRSDNYYRPDATSLRSMRQRLREVHNSSLVEEIQSSPGYTLTVGNITFKLAEAHGFCWGVERAVAIAYESRRRYPDKTIWMTNEVIHNPTVNRNLEKLGIRYIPRDAANQKDFSVAEAGDVVVLPAFGAAVKEMVELKRKGVIIVDTTCPWVSKVWSSVERHKKGDYTSIIHGKSKHEETIATSSFAEKYLILKDLKEAEYVCKFMLNRNREQLVDAFFEKFPADRYSAGFDPLKDLVKVGVANQTTMLKGETALIAKLFEKTLLQLYGPDKLNEHFVAFNTICDATQERQDALYKLVGEHYEQPQSDMLDEFGIGSQVPKPDDTQASSDSEQLDMMLVVGGFNSSNTEHLQEISVEAAGVKDHRAFHIDGPARIDEVHNTITHKPVETPPSKFGRPFRWRARGFSSAAMLGRPKLVPYLEMEYCFHHSVEAARNHGLAVTHDFLPGHGQHITIGVTSGASTPDDVGGALGPC
ncbi:YEATS domain-containing protein 4 [Perkinsus olseni]|uniref:4-hydroxy-3-methylbut-2-enyl diphosphate reductase n=1 Tax=Perkinsus olseni TaxID=32597 RepID=A0A7J6LBI4_PEROL|nr:YEATS domain-containing protein 4 [Perkinsus olseni]